MADRWIYFIQRGSSRKGYIKIGIAANVKERLTQLQCGQPFRLRVLATMPGDAETERLLHARYASVRKSGEWFSATPELLADIRRARETIQAPMKLKREVPEEVKAMSKDFAALLRKTFVDAIKASGLRQRELAGIAGVSVDGVKGWKKQRALPVGMTLIALARAHPAFRHWLLTMIDTPDLHPGAQTNALRAGIQLMQEMGNDQ
jgi:DNA-binding transcriptional regulator YiaG